MAICKGCGKEHGMVLEDKETGVSIPTDWCYVCLFKQGWSYCPPKPIEINEDVDYQKRLREAQDLLLRDMINSSGVSKQILGELD